MMKLAALVLLVMPGVSLQAQDPHAAMIAALRNWGAQGQIEVQQIEFSVESRCEVANQKWKIRGARFDAILGAWVVRATCPGSTVPFLAIVHVSDPQWLRAIERNVKTRPILVRAGERKELSVEFAGGRITQPVVCLKSGKAGDWIRVRSLEPKIVHRVLVGETGELILSGGQ